MNERLLKAADDLRLAIESDEAMAGFREFLDILADISRQPELLQCGDVQTFLRETAPLVRKARVPLGEAIADIERYVGSEFYGDEWFQVCLRRSKLQSVKDLYNDLVEVNWDTFLDFENVDYMLQQKGDHEGPVEPDRLPPGIPTSHWWWWYPSQPPHEGSQ